MKGEVRPGYKQTEVGVIPEDWEVAPLSTLCRSICDGTHFTPRYVPQGIPFYSVENVTANDFSNTKFISEAEHAALVGRCKPERGDILMTRIGSLGDTRILDWEVNASIYVSLALLKPNDHIDAKYLYCYSWSRAFVLDVEKRSLLNATPKKINMGDIGAVPVPFPVSKREQQAIAEALSDVDALIGALDRLIAKKRAIKQGAMQELLRPKDEWHEKPIAEIADCLDNLRIPLNDTQRSKMKGDYPYCGANGILDYISDYRVDDTVVLIAEDGGYFDEYMTRPIAYRMSGRFWVNNHAHILKAKPDFEQDFLFYSLVHRNILSFLASGTRAKLNRSELDKITIQLPVTKEAQTAIAAILSDMDAEIAALERRRDKTKLLKQGMMQELLTGRIRLV